MLLKAVIKNFESHKHTEIDFTEGTNVIIGESDSGKSGIFRAIYWVTTNRPLGDTFRSTWGGDTSVTLYFGEKGVVKDTIERIKTSSHNRYIVNGKVLSAIGTEVPEEVTEILKFDMFNIQSQFDPPFLLANTPGEASRILNKAATIDDIDLTISNLNHSLFITKADLTYNEKELEKCKKAIQAYNNLDEMETLIEEVEEKERQQKSLSQQWEALNQLTLDIEDIQYQVDVLSNIPDLLEKVKTVEGWYAELRRHINQYNRLNQLMEDITGAVLGLEATKNVSKSISLLHKLEEIYTTMERTQNQYRSLERVIIRIGHTLSAIKEVDKTISSLEAEYEKLAPDTCPLCGAEMRKENKNA